jgi:hypothetical protein
MVFKSLCGRAEDLKGFLTKERALLICYSHEAFFSAITAQFLNYNSHYQCSCLTFCSLAGSRMGKLTFHLEGIVESQNDE